VSYTDRNTAVAVTVGAGADDGGAAERDDVRADVEVVLGGGGADALGGGTTPVTLNGSQGADQLVGGSADDTLIGGAGPTCSAAVTGGTP
jgi:Ca2+-binding RTX toxin-like protein